MDLLKVWGDKRIRIYGEEKKKKEKEKCVNYVLCIPYKVVKSTIAC